MNSQKNKSEENLTKQNIISVSKHWVETNYILIIDWHKFLK